VKLNTAMPVAPSPPWRHHHGLARASPPRAPGKTLDPAFGSGGGDATMSFLSWGRRRWLMMSSVRKLESIMGTDQSWDSRVLRTPSLVLCGRPSFGRVRSRRSITDLGAYGRALRWLVPSRSSSQPREVFFDGCDAA
jgi:hypothetical protein